MTAWLARYAPIALAILLLAPILAPSAQAHEVRPAYLQIDQIGPDRYDVLWRTPLYSGMRLPVVLRLPEGVRDAVQPRVQELSDSLIERHVVVASGGLAGRRIDFVGLQVTITDVMVRVQESDGHHAILLVHPAQPWVTIEDRQGLADVARSYIVHGIDHILFSADHLLFVLGLLLLVHNRWMLLKTITAFTAAHSITLAAATLGYINVPAPPLNAAIALSILFLGVEVVRSWRGETSLARSRPWLVAFAFGLLHGLGFASGLLSLGLPHGDIPAALLFFNIGVEVGQLLFVAVLLLLVRAFRLLEIRWPRAVVALPAYTVGTLGAYWTIDRIVVMFGGSG
jgi:hydrogenase/urease accessory protein HupE